MYVSVFVWWCVRVLAFCVDIDICVRMHEWHVPNMYVYISVCSYM